MKERAIFQALQIRTLITGVIGGFVSGMTGLGGGTVMVPLLTGYLKMPQRLAAGTSLAVVMFAAAAAGSRYIWRDDIDWGLVGALVGGSTIGAYLGARLIMRINPRNLRLMFSVVLFAAGIRMLVT